MSKKLTVDFFGRPDCPEWAKYAAVNADGSVRVFLNQPTTQYKLYWYDPTSYWEQSLKGDTFDASDWRNSLVKRPPVTSCLDGMYAWLCAPAENREE